MRQAKRTGVRIPAKLEPEFTYFREKYGVTDSYLLILAFKLVDRKKMEEIMQLMVDNKGYL